MTKVTLSVENRLYRRYMEKNFAEKRYSVTSVAEKNLAQAIAETPPEILLLQSDTSEHSLIELARKLKRIFAQEIKIILLSSDYLTKEDAGAAVDCFFQFPLLFETIEEAIKELQDDTRRILIIDDSKLVHKHLTSPLEEAGYEVFGAENGQEGLAQALEIKPNLIICDIEMPKMNGFEVCSAIRSNPETSDIYIIMSSTLSSSSDQQKGFKAGVDEYIIKPVVIPELLDRIKKVFKSTLVGRENILILEQDRQIADNMAKSISKQGFTARVLCDVKSTLKLLKKIHYDLVISEIDLADGNAIDLAAALKSLPEQEQPAMLIITSRDSDADTKMVMNAGAAGVISKPFSMDSLLATVERTLADRRASMEKAQLEKYVSKASLSMALEKSILSGKESSIRADIKRATIFFSDIESFTSRCERYSPKQIVAQINALFDVVTRVIMGNEGDIDKFIGDACMAFWLDKNPAISARRAVRSFIILNRELALMNETHPVLSKDPIRIRVGINTGEIILCDIGSADARIDLTTIGDPVNLASRLESASKQYGIYNLVSEYTIKHLFDEFGARKIDLVRVKGKKKPVECYEVFNTKKDLTENEINLISSFDKGIEAFRNGDFKDALAVFTSCDKLEKVTQSGKLNPSRVYQARCRKLIENSPTDWNGVWTLDSK
ncbi:response regulator [Desulfobacterales bacterium HSG16]|nr:response regulator [Desulfobacterales bacterium HSG16]